MKNLFISLLFVSLFSCSKNPFVSKDVIEKIDQANNPDITNVGVIYNNDVYYFSNFKNNPVQITNTPTVTKSQIRVNHGGTQIAYLNSAGSPVIIDKAGNVVATLSQYTGVTKIDWTFDDLTLYILKGNQVYFYGTTPTIPAITYNTISGDGVSPSLTNFAISPNKDIVYSYKFYSISFGGYLTNVVFILNGSTTESSLDLQGYSGSYDFRVLNYSKKGEIMVGASDPSASSNVVTTFSIYNYKETYTGSPFVGIESYITPVYNSSLICTIAAINPSSSSGNYYLASERYQSNSNVSHSSFNDDTNPIYTDWK